MPYVKAHVYIGLDIETHIYIWGFSDCDNCDYVMDSRLAPIYVGQPSGDLHTVSPPSTRPFDNSYPYLEPHSGSDRNTIHHSAVLSFCTRISMPQSTLIRYTNIFVIVCILHFVLFSNVTNIKYYILHLLYNNTFSLCMCIIIYCNYHFPLP